MRSSAYRLAGYLLLTGLSLLQAQDVPPRGGKGRIIVITNPPRAEAYMDGVDLGPTPVDTAFASGRYTLTLLLNGQELAHQRVNIWPDSTTTIRRGLTLPYGNLTLTTRPVDCDCKVYVDSEEVASTQGAPLTLDNLKAGTHHVRVTDGKKSREYEVQILPEGKTELVADFLGNE